MKILLLGATGQLGQAFCEIAAAEGFPIGWSLTAWSHREGDLSEPEALIKKIRDFNPAVLMNAAAFTQVDQAESQKELCEKINAKTPGILASYCGEMSIPFVHFSTDYVYEGKGVEPHLETEIYKPQNFYGLTKSQGDHAIEEAGGEYLIFRTSWVYSHLGKNFVRTMIHLGESRDTIKVVNDQWGCPSYAPDLAKASWDALMIAIEAKLDKGSFPSGVYHICNSGTTNWCEFAKAILKNKNIMGIPSSEYPTPAHRPLNSRLSVKKLNQTFGLSLRPWGEALTECLKKIDSLRKIDLIEKSLHHV